MRRIMGIGRFHGMDREALRKEFDARLIGELTELAGMAADAREQIVGVAYNAHGFFDGPAMDRLPNLKMIAKYGVGYDSIDVAAASARGITVTNTPGVLDDDVADLAVGMWIAIGRELEPAIALMRSGGWPRGGPRLARKVSGRRVGILGLGRIGRAIATRLAAFDCEIHYFARAEKTTPGWRYHAQPTELAAAVDDLFVSVVGGTGTENLVSAEVLAALGADGVLVNIARGSVVDEAALIAALEGGTIRAAALDVFRNEPNVDPRLTRMPNVLPLPHIGTATVETRAAMGILQRSNLHALLDGRPAVTPVN